MGNDYFSPPFPLFIAASRHQPGGRVLLSVGRGHETVCHQPCETTVCHSTSGIERAQALADISRSALLSYSNETLAAIANPPNSAQLEGTPSHSPKLHAGPCSSVGMRRWTDRHTVRHTETAVTTIHFASSTTRVKCNKVKVFSIIVEHRPVPLWRLFDTGAVKQV